MEAETAIDDAADFLAEEALAVPGDPSCVPALLEALGEARSDLTRRSLALAVVMNAKRDDRAAVVVLFREFEAARHHRFLGPALLEILGLYALRSPLARAKLLAELLLLEINDSRYLLVKAAQVIGGLYFTDADPALREILGHIVTSEDLAVEGEARYQMALILFADSILSGTQQEMREHVIAAHAAFIGVTDCEEFRPDAHMFALLLEMALSFDDLRKVTPDRLARVLQLGDQLRGTLTRLTPRDWREYRSDAHTMLAARALATAEAFQAAARAIDESDAWTNIESAFIDLAQLYSLAHLRSQISEHYPQLHEALAGITPQFILPHLGPVLAHKVGVKRLQAVAERYARSHGNDEVTVSLRDLAKVASQNTVLEEQELAQRLSPLAQRTGESAQEITTKFIEALENDSIEVWVRKYGGGRAQLPIDKIGQYGGDRAVDAGVRHVLGKAREQLGDYSLTAWLNLSRAAEAIVSFVHSVRDDLPDYTLCTNNGGMGQRATERNLQDDVFDSLRRTFGRGAIYEKQRLGGGRPDTGLEIGECTFPIEVKAEHKSIEREHIRQSYVAQSDLYATARDRVCFLLILDLRSSNADGHQQNMRTHRKENSPALPTSLYTLEDGLWISSMPLDPEIENPQSKVVIVVLVPGNRPRPSSLTPYSRRPSGAAKSKNTGGSSS